MAGRIAATMSALPPLSMSAGSGKITSSSGSKVPGFRPAGILQPGEGGYGVFGARDEIHVAGSIDISRRDPHPPAVQRIQGVFENRDGRGF